MSSAAIQGSRPLRPAGTRTPALATLGILTVAMSSAAQEPQNDDSAPPLPAQSHVEAIYEGETYRIDLVHELLNDPDVSTVFNVPGHSAIGADGRQYHVDSGDRTVHVLDGSGSHIVDIGKEGQGPGEFQTPRLVAVASDGGVYVWDRTKRSIEVFNSSYEYVRSAALPFAIAATSMHEFEPGVLLLGGTTLAEPGIGFGIHLFSIDGSEADHIKSFGDTPEVDPAYYEGFARGFAWIDLDGGILYNQMGPYSVRKYTRDGRLLWQIDDPDLVPPPLASAKPDAGGRLQVGRYAISGAIIPVRNGLYLHIILAPPEDAPLAGRVLYERTFELIEVEGEQPRRRIQFDMPDPLLYTTRDLEGRLYGLWHEWDFKIIRSTINVSKGGRS